MSKHFHLCWILGSLLLFSSISLAQDQPDEKVVADEIRYYIVNEDYTSRREDLIWTDKQAVERARFLSRKYERQFVEASKEYLSKADSRQVSRLIWIYLQISAPDHRPLLSLFSPDSFETTFKNANEIIATLVRLLGKNYTGSSVYAVEVLAALKYRAAIPEMISVLNSETNPDVPTNLIALADLGAKKELATYLQQKVLEDLCIAKGHDVRNGVPITAITHKFPAAGQRNDSKYAWYFNDLYDSTDWNPDEQALARYAVAGQSERLRGYAVLLLSHNKIETALNVILDRLENDRSSLVVVWAAWAASRNPTSRVVDTLIAVYDRSEDARIRLSCTESLGMIGGEKAILALRKALNDVNPQVREMAKFRLSQLGERND